MSQIISRLSKSALLWSSALLIGSLFGPSQVSAANSQDIPESWVSPGPDQEKDKDK